MFKLLNIIVWRSKSAIQQYRSAWNIVISAVAITFAFSVYPNAANRVTNDASWTCMYVHTRGLSSRKRGAIEIRPTYYRIPEENVPPRRLPQPEAR